MKNQWFTDEVCFKHNTVSFTHTLPIDSSMLLRIDLQGSKEGYNAILICYADHSNYLTDKC